MTRRTFCSTKQLQVAPFTTAGVLVLACTRGHFDLAYVIVTRHEHLVQSRGVN